MEILTVMRARLQAAGVNPNGGHHLMVVAQNAPRPNTLMELGDDGDEWSHQGPVGLNEAHIIIHSRADSDQAAATLGRQVEQALNEWMGTYFGIQVQLLRHITTKAAYRDTSTVYIQTSEFQCFYRRVS